MLRSVATAPFMLRSVATAPCRSVSLRSVNPSGRVAFIGKAYDNERPRFLDFLDQPLAAAVDEQEQGTDFGEEAGGHHAAVGAGTGAGKFARVTSGNGRDWRGSGSRLDGGLQEDAGAWSQ